MLFRTLSSFTILMYLSIYLLKRQTLSKTCTSTRITSQRCFFMKNILENQTKCEVNFESGIFKFWVSHKKRINKILKSLKFFSKLSQVSHMMFSKFTKLQKVIVHHSHQFYRQSKLQHIKQPSSSCLNFLTLNEFIIKDSSSFAKQFVDQNNNLSMINVRLILFWLLNHLRRLSKCTPIQFMIKFDS